MNSEVISKTNPTLSMPTTLQSRNQNPPKLYTPNELSALYEKYADVPYLVNGFLGAASIACLVGRSGLGKSALLYQLCITVAAGVPFLGHETHQGKAIYFDFENSIGQVKSMIESLAKFLGLDSVPNELLCCNANDPEASRSLTGFDVIEIIRHEKPKLAVIDSLSAAFPNAEEKNSGASETLSQLRSAAREAGTTIVFVHHLRKNGGDNLAFAPRLGRSDLSAWFAQVRGASALINNSDTRIGFDDYGSNGLLVMQGFARVTGELPVKLFKREYDDDGQPLGYWQASQVQTLSDQDRHLFERLPNEFRFKDAMQLAGITNKPTNDLLKRLLGAGVIAKRDKGYIKVPDDKEREFWELEELEELEEEMPPNA